MLLPILIAVIVIESAVIILLVIDRGQGREPLARQPGLDKSAHPPSQEEQFAGRLIRAQDEERQRLSRYLHDEVGQQLSLLAIDFDLLCRSLASAGHEIEEERANRLKHLTDEITSDIHWLSDQLYSAKLQHLGLQSAIKEFSNKVSHENQLSITLSMSEGTLLPPDVALCSFRVIQEALNNVVKHSQAESVSIDFMVIDEAAHLRIQDNGSGFDPRLANSGLGMQIMRERVRMMGGQFVVNSIAGEGTIITASVPLKDKFGDVGPSLSDNAA